jgi:hypothetical protein
MSSSVDDNVNRLFEVSVGVISACVWYYVLTRLQAETVVNSRTQHQRNITYLIVSAKAKAQAPHPPPLCSRPPSIQANSVSRPWSDAKFYSVLPPVYLPRLRLRKVSQIQVRHIRHRQRVGQGQVQQHHRPAQISIRRSRCNREQGILTNPKPIPSLSLSFRFLFFSLFFSLASSLS